MKKIVLNVRKEVGIADIENSCHYLGLDVTRIEVLDRGLLGARPPHYLVEAEVKDDAILEKPKSRGDGQKVES